jgi:hypothetical protein
VSKLFISHAAHDKPLVEAFVDLLEGGVGVPHRAIFCTSFRGQSIAPGEHFVESIRAELGDATSVIALISEAYYASAFCMCELGGVWLQSKDFLPVLVPPVGYADLKAVLGVLQVSKIDSPEHLDELRDELARRLEIEPHPTPTWSRKRDAFLVALPGLLAATRFTGPVDRATFQKAVKERDEYRAECAARDAEVSRLNAIVADLKQAKGAEAVAAVIRAHSSEPETFEELVRTARAALGRLSRPTRVAVYYRIRNELCVPENWEDVRLPIEYGELAENFDESAVSANPANAKVRAALDAVEALDSWLRRASDDFGRWYAGESDGEKPELTLRSFWDRHLW